MEGLTGAGAPRKAVLEATGMPTGLLGQLAVDG